MHETIYNQIIRYLEDNGESWSGVMCRVIHDQSGHKEAIIERRARELEVDGKIGKVYAQVDGKGPRCVKYYLKPEILATGYINNGDAEWTINRNPDFLKKKQLEEVQGSLL